MRAKQAAPEMGEAFETVFWRNEGARQKEFPFRATLVNGKKSSKVILANDPTIPMGRPARVRVKKVTRPQSEGRGFIEVEYLGPVVFELDPEIYLDRQIARKLQVLLEAGYSILLDGPQGSGKTVLSRAIADALDMVYVYFNCSSVYEATDFVATLQLRASEAGPVETRFMPTNICLALREAAKKPDQRYLVFLDELNRCRPMARNGLMPALDSTRKIYDPTDNTLLDIPENVQFIAAINNGAQFVGTTTVDPAQVDRFATLKVNYPPPEEEVKILVRRYPALGAVLILRVVRAAHAVREDETLGVDLSMRATEEACVLLSHPFFGEESSPEVAIREVLLTAFCGRFAGEPEDESTEAGAVWRVVTRNLQQKS